LEEELASKDLAPGRKEEIEKKLAENETKQEDVKQKAEGVRKDWAEKDETKKGVARRKSQTEAAVTIRSGGDKEVKKAMEKTIKTKKESMALDKKA
jgi:hypothetical protein